MSSKTSHRSRPLTSPPLQTQPQPVVLPPKHTPQVVTATVAVLRAMGPEATARAAGQALFDLTIIDPHSYVGGLTTFGNLLHSRLLRPDGGPTPYLETLVTRLAKHSMLQSDPPMLASLAARITTFLLFAEGTLAAQED